MISRTRNIVSQPHKPIASNIFTINLRYVKRHNTTRKEKL